MANTIPTPDFPSDISTSGILGAGTTLEAVAEFTGDHDWFKAELTAGTAYLFKLDPLGMSVQYGRQAIADLQLLDSSGQVLASNVDISAYAPRYVQYTPDVSGAYYLRAGFGDMSGSYKVSMETPAPDAVPSQASAAPLVQTGVKVEGLFDYAGDRDWYRFHAEVGQHLKFGTPKSTAADAMFASDVAFYDMNGKPLAYRYPFEPLVSGDYYVSLQGNSKGSYTLLMTELADDYAANASTTGRVQPGGAAVSGKFDYASDTDAFRIPVVAGKIYTLRVAGDTAGQYQISHGAADIASGASYPVGTGAGGQSFKATASGDALIFVTQYASSAPASGYAYTLQVDAGVDDDHGDDAAHATSIAPGQPAHGVLQGGRDTDTFKLELQAGVTYDLSVTTPDTAAAQKLSMLLQDGDGKRIAGGDYFNALSKFSLTPVSSGTYYAHVSGAEAAFTFNAVAARDDYSANSGTIGRLPVGGSIRGTLESSADNDWFAVDLQAGVTYWFGSESRDSTQHMHYSGPYLSLVDAKGASLAELPSGLGSNTKAYMPYVPVTSGTYYVSAARTLGDNYPANYTVTAQVGEQDDYGATRATAGWLAENSLVKGRLALAQDKDMFRFAAKAGTTYVMELTGGSGYPWDTGLSASVDSDLPGTGLLRETGNSSSKTTVFEPQASGDYYFTVKGDGSTTGDYGLRLRPVPGDAIPADKTTTALLQPGLRLNSVLESKYDGDWYKLEVQQGRTYAVELLGAVSGNGTLNTQAAVLNTTDSMGYTTSLDSGYAYHGYSEPVLTLKPSYNGNYHVGVEGKAVVEGSYVLQVTDITNDRQGPVLASVSHSGAAKLDLFDTITLAFDERIKVDAGGVLLKNASGATVSLETATGKSDAPLAAGSKLVLDPSSRLQPGATYTLELKPGAITDIAGNPYSGVVSLTFTTQPLLDTGTGGNDYLKGAGVSGQVLGGPGTDTAMFAGRSSYFNITGHGNGKFTVSNRFSTSDTVTLDGVERMMFEYDAVALDVEGIAGQAYRLYQAAFNRTPDQSGVGYWIAQMDKGMALTDVARSFVASAEFQKLYGANPTDAAFVDMLYNNVLHRAPDAAGAAYWNGALRDGLPREQALAYFSEGKENHDAVAKLIANGFSYMPYG